MDASLRDFYEKKIHRLEFDNLQLQEAILAKPTDQYKLKYELLLEQVAEQQTIKQSKITEQQQNKDDSLKEAEEKWENNLAEKTKELKIVIENLQQENKRLTGKNTDLEMKSVRLQKEIDEGDTDVIKFKYEGVRKENQRLRKELNEAYSHCEKKVANLKHQSQEAVQRAKERQKISYRTQIQQLQLHITQLQQALAQTQKRASPEREVNLQDFEKQLIKEKNEMTQEITSITKVMQKKEKENIDYQAELQKQTECHVTTLKDLNDKLKEYEAQLFMKNYERENQIAELQRSMDKKRQVQANDLKEEIRRNEASFQRERSEWKSIIDQFETENRKIKKDRQDEKIKFKEQKKKLQDKIGELRVRLKEKEEQLLHGENEKLLKSLRDMDEGQENFASYENAITFMDRQVRKYAMKIQEKDTEINSLLEELKLQQKESEEQLAQAREKARQQVKKLYDKLFDAQDEYDSLTLEAKETEREIKKMQKDMEVEQEHHAVEVENQKRIIEWIQKDYQRVIANKKALEESFRGERQSVVTSRIDLNQERKNKYKDLHRQKRQLELAYKEKIEQVHQHYQIQLQKLNREKHQITIEKEELRAQNITLREKVGAPKDHVQDRYADYQAKLATLDLQISLTQNLFKNLTQTIAKGSPFKSSQLGEMKEDQSDELSQHEYPSYRIQAEQSGGTPPVDGDVTPTLQSVQMPSGEFSMRNTASFSFCPPKRK